MFGGMDMKKLTSLMIFITLTLATTSVCFAETSDFYNFDGNTVIKMEGISGGAALMDLPRTGGIPPETFYIAGVIIIFAALLIAFKGNKAKAKKT
jgi:LPXTG-motif cell wall-anchored protein